MPGAERITIYYENDGKSFFTMIDPSLPGIRLKEFHQRLGLRACPAAVIEARNIKMSDSTVIFSIDEGREILMRANAVLNGLIASIAAGNARGAFAHAWRYANERYQGGIEEIPVINVENACASSSSAFHLAWMSVASGLYDVALALGVEKLYSDDRKVSFAAPGSAVDVEVMSSIRDALKSMKGDRSEESGSKRSIFMDFYSMLARVHMEQYGTKKEHFAKIAQKNHYHGSLNPYAQYREIYTLEEIMNAPVVSEPLTRPMCSPVGDGAAAILCRADIAARYTSKPVYVAASVVVSGKDRGFDEPDVVERAAERAYRMSGIDAGDLDVLELHDATSV